MEVPEEVTRFILENIDSVVELEALLLMRRERQAAWMVTALAERLYVEPAVAAAVVERLARRRFVRETDEGVEFDPDHERLQALDQVAAVYSRLLIPITQLIHSKPSSSIRSFADAFRLRDRD